MFKFAIIKPIEVLRSICTLYQQIIDKTSTNLNELEKERYLRSKFIVLQLIFKIFCVIIKNDKFDLSIDDEMVNLDEDEVFETEKQEEDPLQELVEEEEEEKIEEAKIDEKDKATSKPTTGPTFQAVAPHDPETPRPPRPRSAGCDSFRSDVPAHARSHSRYARARNATAASAAGSCRRTCRNPTGSWPRSA